MDRWRAKGKKVMVSFGGASMGGSWAGAVDHCWDFCFGKEEQISTALVNIVQEHNLDGVDLDYEVSLTWMLLNELAFSYLSLILMVLVLPQYCYDIGNTQSGRCQQRETSLYSDAAAQNFLSSMTSLLRQKLDALGGGYELTHAPMDSDLGADSPYYQLLKEQYYNLSFLMPQFCKSSMIGHAMLAFIFHFIFNRPPLTAYIDPPISADNGYTRPALDGFAGTGAGSQSVASIYTNLATDMFPNEPNKVVFGFCISDCGATDSNADASQAVQVMSELKAYNNEQFKCNGGA